MEKIITLNDVSKEFKVLNRREGLMGSFKDLFSRDYRIIHAVKLEEISTESVIRKIYEGGLE